MKKNTPTIEEILGTILITVIFLSAAFQVFNRFVLHLSAPWTEELCRYSFIWLALMGIANGIYRGTHLNVDLIDGFLSPGAKKVLAVILDIIFFLVMLYMFWISIPYLQKTMKYGTKSVGLQIKMWYVYLILPLFSGMAMLRLIQKYVLKLTKKDGQDAAEGKDISEPKQKGAES